MPVMVIPEIGIICPGLGTVEMDPEKFPWIFIRTDVGVFPGTVEKKTVTRMQPLKRSFRLRITVRGR